MATWMLAALLAASPGAKVAAPGWNAVNVKPELAAFYADHLAQALRREGVTVVSAQDIAALLGMERQKTLLGCSSEQASCLAELGNALGCEGTLVVSVAKLDDSFNGTLRILSARDATVLSETTVRADSEKGLLGALDDAAVELAAPLRPKPAARSLRKYSWIPALAGAAFLAGGAASFGAAGDTWDRMGKVTSYPAAEDLAKSGRTYQGLGWAGAGLGAAALAGACALYFIDGDEPPVVTPSVAVTPSGAFVGVQGVFP